MQGKQRLMFEELAINRRLRKVLNMGKVYDVSDF